MSLTPYRRPDSPSGGGGRVGSRPGGAAEHVAGVVSGGSLVLLVAAYLTVPDVVASAAPALAIGGLLLGLPHGAIDHMVPFWVDGSRVTSRALTQVLAGYLAVAAIAAAALLAAPDVAVGVFLVVSAVHFGRGDVAFAAERAGRPLPRATADLPVVLAHGAVVVALPYALWNDASAPVLAQIAPALANPPAYVLATLVALTSGVVVLAAARLVARRRWLELSELGLLAVTFCVVPPLAAFGLYFGLWHAGRHTSRLVALASRAEPGTPGIAAAVGRYARHATVPTLLAGVTLVVVARTDDASVLAAELAVLLALTFPHVRTVQAMDAALSAPGGVR